MALTIEFSRRSTQQLQKIFTFYDERNGDNLLAQKYEIILGQPMPRATFMTGVNLKF